jgi:hypothetical protein
MWPSESRGKLRIGEVEMTTAEIALQTSQDEGERVVCWRLLELRRAGYGIPQAIALAVHTEVDLHLACRLLRRGCPAETAMRILL